MATPESIPEDITHELYKRNAELAVKNKTLSLLSKLYEIGILTLEPAPLAERITQSIQTGLDFDLVGVFRYDDEKDTLMPLHFAKSKRLEQVLEKSAQEFDNLTISGASRHELFGKIFSGSGAGHTDDLVNIWDGLVPKDKLAAAKKEAHLRTVLFYPLTIQDQKVLGVLMIGLNRGYQDLSGFEQESIHNFVNVIAIALGKALLYQELQVTNLKLAEANERLEEFDRLKSEFISMAGHQLRAPLTVIKGYISLVIEGTIDGEVSDKIKEALGKAMFSTEQLVKLISSLLDLSRIEAGKIRYEFKAGDFQAMALEVIDKFRQNAEKKGLALVFENKAGGLPPVTFDPDKMREVVVNLIDNAIKYSNEGEEVKIVEERVAGQDGERIRVSVKDSGLGVKSGDIVNLFAKFSRTEEAKARDPNGIGIGLYFVKRIVEDHGGAVGAFSEGVGKGSTFWIEIPLQHDTVVQKSG